MFKVIEDEAKKSGVRLTSIFSEAFKNAKFHFSDSFDRDMHSLGEYFDQISSGISHVDAFKNTMEKASISAKEFAKSQNITTTSILDFVNKQKTAELGLISQNHSLVTCNTLIREYQNGLKNCGISTDDFIAGIESGNPILANYLKNLNGAKATLGGYIKYLASAKAAAIGLQLATAALNAVISAGVALFISSVATTKQRAEEAREAAANMARSYKDTSKSLDDYIQRVGELRKEIDEGNLSEGEAYEKRKDLLTIQEELIAKFGDEAKGIDLVTGSIRKQISAIEELSKADWRSYQREHHDEIIDANRIFTDVKPSDIFAEYSGKKLIDALFYNVDASKEFETLNEFQKTKFWDDFFDNIEESIPKEAIAGIQRYTTESPFVDFDINPEGKSAEDILEYYNAIYDTLEILGKQYFGEDYENYIGEILSGYSNDISKIKQVIEDNRDTFEYNAEGMLRYGEKYSLVWQEVENAYDAYQTALANGDDEAAAKAFEDMENAKNRFFSIENADSEAVRYATDFFNDFEKTVRQHKLQIELDLRLKDKNNSLSNDLQKVLGKFKTDSGKISLTSIEIAGLEVQGKASGTMSMLNDQQAAYVQLSRTAAEYEVEVVDLVNALSDLGYIQLEVSETGDGTYNGTEKIISNYREIVTALRQAVTEYNTNGYITVDTYNSLAKHGEDYADLCVHTAEGIKLQSDEVATLTEELNQVTGAELAAANASDATIRSTLALASSLLKTSSSTDASLDAISDLVEMQKELEEGTQYSSTEMMELVEQYPQLAGHVEELTKGYGFEADAVRELVAELTELYKKNELLKTQSARTSLATAYNGRYALTADNVDKTFENFASANDGKQITSREDYIIQWKIDFPERTDEDAEKIVSEVWDYVDARIEANVKGEIADRVATGNAQPGYTPTKSDKDKETEFERQYKEHNHLLNMDKESIEDYLAWLRVAYIASYNAGEMELDDFYKYKEEVYEKDKELFADSLSDMEHQISLLGNANIDNSDEIVSMYEDMQRRVHEKANEYREAGLDDNHELLQELQNQWWSYEQAIEKIREEEFDSDLDKINFNIDTLKLNNANSNEILSSYQDILRRINEEIDRYTSEGYDISHEKIRDLTTKLRDTKDEIIDYLNEIVEKANDAVDGYQNVYTTLTDAAKEYASTGALSVDSFQSILELGPKYLSFLYDENGQLTINKESIKQVIAAKTEELAVETALAYAKQVLRAAQENNIAKIVELTSVSAAGTASTWEMAYATLGLAKAIGTANGMDASYFDNAADNLAKIQSMSKTAVNTIDTYYATLEDGYVSQADGLNTIIELTQDMIKWENEQLIDALEKEKEDYSDIIDQKKELIRLAKEQADRESSVADKLEKAAKLQSQIAQLALDDDREAQAQRRSLEEQLAELQKEISKEQADHSFELQEEALDKELDAFEDAKDDEIEEQKKMLQSTEALYQAAIARIGDNWHEFYNELRQWNAEYGSMLEEDLVASWDAATAAVERYGSVVDAKIGLKNDTDLGEHVESSSGSKHESYTAASSKGKDIKSRMRQNSIDWFTSNNQKSIEQDQQKLAEEWYHTFGERLTPKNGSWYRENGEVLYTLTDEEVGKAVVSKMEANAAAWHTASESERARLEAENERLKTLLENFLGVKIKKTLGGVWMLGNRELFDVYHTGGVVGGGESKKEKEVLALLEEGELVLTKQMKSTLLQMFDSSIQIDSGMYKNIGSAKQYASEKLMESLAKYEDTMQNILDKIGFVTSGKMEQKIEVGDIYAPVNVVKELTEDEIRKHAKQIGELSAGHIREAFTKLGIKRTASLL